MDAELYNKGLKTICAGNGYSCRGGQIGYCILFDINKEACCTKPFYNGDIDPVPIVAQWLAEHPEEEITKMKSTGIIRRIDDLGRIVIPKEIRRTMEIQEDDPLEIGIVGNEVRLTKYTSETKPLPELPGKLNPLYFNYAEVNGKINAIIDYLKAREKNESNK